MNKITAKFQVSSSKTVEGDRFLSVSFSRPLTISSSSLGNSYNRCTVVVVSGVLGNRHR